jgi:hypothetical protein
MVSFDRETIPRQSRRGTTASRPSRHFLICLRCGPSRPVGRIHTPTTSGVGAGVFDEDVHGLRSVERMCHSTNHLSASCWRGVLRSRRSRRGCSRNGGPALSTSIGSRGRGFLIGVKTGIARELRERGERPARQVRVEAFGCRRGPKHPTTLILLLQHHQSGRSSTGNQTSCRFVVNWVTQSSCLRKR